MLKIALINILLVFYIYLCAVISVPNQIVLFEGENFNFKMIKGLNISLQKEYETALASSNLTNKISNTLGNKKANLELFSKISLKQIDVNIIEKTKVIPLGNAIGMKLYTKGVLVVGMSQINLDDGKTVKPYENSGIEEGDTIVEIDGETIENTEELINKLNDSNGNQINVKFVKENKIMQASITPVKANDSYKIGLWVRDTQAGVGTATFYEPSTNKFMTLGHGITDIDTGKIVNIANGELVTANIISIVKGEKGKPRRNIRYN